MEKRNIMDSAFNTIEELYNRVRPALRSKVREFKRNNIFYVKEEDIWNFLVDNKWKMTKGLELNDVVDDILNTDNDKIVLYVQTKMGKFVRRANLKNTTIL